MQKHQDMNKFISLIILLSATFLLNTCFGPSKIQHGSIDIQGTKVKTIIHENQEWMAQNLNVSHFANGEPIFRAKTAKEWKQAGDDGKAAWCYYQNNKENGKKYGKLYNWHAISDPRGLAPEGWRVPNNTDWETLIDNIGNPNNAGERMKSTENWLNAPKGNLKDGFNAMPAGGRDNTGTFTGLKSRAFFWSATDQLMFYGNYFVITYNTKSIEQKSIYKDYGFSVRCMRDIKKPESTQ